MEKLEEGTSITATLESGIIFGYICGIVNELPVVGYTYIIKITQRTGDEFEKYPYSCIALPRSLFQVV